MPEEQDDLRQTLRQLAIPATHADAMNRIMTQARQNPRKVWKWLGALRQVRAMLYIPRMRYAIMASGVAFFILVGLIAPSPPAHLSEEALLLDVDFDEENWAADFWIDEPTEAQM